MLQDNEACEHIGIKSDKADLRDTIHDITDHEMRTISPDCILPTNLFKSVLSNKYVVIPTAATYYSADSTDEQIVPDQYCNTDEENCAPKPKTPVKISQGGKNKRKRYTPKHSPLLDVSNILGYGDDEEESIVPSVPKAKRPKTTSQPVSGKVIKKGICIFVHIFLLPVGWQVALSSNLLTKVLPRYTYYTGRSYYEKVCLFAFQKSVVLLWVLQFPLPFLH